MKIADIGRSELDFMQTGEARLQEICGRFGFENASYAHIDKSKNIVHGCTTFPAEWTRHYIENDLILSDPLIRFGATMIAPIDWTAFDNQSDYAALFEAARKFGVGRNGLTIPVINPFGERGVFTVTSNAPRAEWRGIDREDAPCPAPRSPDTAPACARRHRNRLQLSIGLLSGDELDVLKMLASGLIPSVIAKQTGNPLSNGGCADIFDHHQAQRAGRSNKRLRGLSAQDFSNGAISLQTRWQNWSIWNTGRSAAGSSVGPANLTS